MVHVEAGLRPSGNLNVYYLRISQPNVVIWMKFKG